MGTVSLPALTRKSRAVRQGALSGGTTRALKPALRRHTRNSGDFTESCPWHKPLPHRGFGPKWPRKPRSQIRTRSKRGDPSPPRGGMILVPPLVLLVTLCQGCHC
jgi:hypothetical protein